MEDKTMSGHIIKIDINALKILKDAKDKLKSTGITKTTYSEAIRYLKDVKT